MIPPTKVYNGGVRRKGKESGKSGSEIRFGVWQVDRDWLFVIFDMDQRSQGINIKQQALAKLLVQI
jgi:hypothetical protein